MIEARELIQLCLLCYIAGAAAILLLIACSHMMARDFANTISKRLAEELQKAVWKRCDNLKNTLKNEEH